MELIKETQEEETQETGGRSRDQTIDHDWCEDPAGDRQIGSRRHGVGLGQSRLNGQQRDGDWLRGRKTGRFIPPDRSCQPIFLLAFSHLFSIGGGVGTSGQHESPAPGSVQWEWFRQGSTYGSQG